VQVRERFDVVVIGAGQAGLSVGYHLARRGVRFVILDAEQRIGDVWRKRWDSLRLFTPARFDALDGMRFPAPGDHFPTKDEMADYLEAYAKRFALPVRHGTRVERLFARDGRYVLQAGGREIEADQVVVAMASYQRPRVPGVRRFAAPDVNQLHSSAIAVPTRCAPATCCWSAPAIRGRRSRSSSRAAAIASSCRAATSATYRSGSAGGWGCGSPGRSCCASCSTGC
jgi:putative flavoprotein involved in K+ transport